MNTARLQRARGAVLALGAAFALAGCSDSTGPDTGFCFRTEYIFFRSGSCLGLRDGGVLDAPSDTIEAVPIPVHPGAIESESSAPQLTG